MTTLTRHKNTDQLVANELSDRDLLNFCVANPNMTICKDDNFWRDLLFKKYGVVTKSADKSWKTFYLQTVYYFDKGNNNVDKSMKLSARAGHRDLVDFFIQNGARDWQEGLYNAARGAHKDLITFFMQQKPGYSLCEFGLAGAARGGQEALVSFFIEKGAHDYNVAMTYAARAGHESLVRFFIESDDCWDWELGMVNAIKAGHRDLVSLFIEKGSRDWSGGIFYASRAGHRDLVDLFVEKIKEEYLTKFVKPK